MVAQTLTNNKMEKNNRT